MSERLLCRIEDIKDGGSAAFTGPIHGRETALLAIRRGDAVFVYINSCPHIGSPLDFTPGQFLNSEKTHIQCSTHGALFTIEDGHCVLGPCVGQHLDPAVTDVRAGTVFLKT